MRIVYYHSFKSRESIELFETHIKYLLNNNYKIVTFSQIAALMLNNDEDKSKYVAITFDDGYRNNFKAYKILKKYDVGGTFFIATKFIGAGNTDYYENKLYSNYKMLMKEQIKEMSDNGMEIGSHTHSHINLAQLLNEDKKQAEYELIKSKEILEEITDKDIVSFSYPNGQRGTFNKNTRKLVKYCGYKYACTTMIKWLFYQNKNEYEIPRIEVKSKDSLKTFVNKVKGRYDCKAYYYNLFNLTKKW